MYKQDDPNKDTQNANEKLRPNFGTLKSVQETRRSDLNEAISDQETQGVATISSKTSGWEGNGELTEMSTNSGDSHRRVLRWRVLCFPVPKLRRCR